MHAGELGNIGINQNRYMTDEIITGAGLGAALGTKLIYDVCGPTAQYLGGALASYTKTGVENLQRVFEYAAQRIHARNKFEGQVPPRVLKDVISEGYFCEDALQASYLGGVLASSKGPVSRDDRAVAYCSLIGSSSSYQLRTHYILYAAALRSTHKPFGDIQRWLQTHGVTVCIGESDYQAAMEFEPNEKPTIIAEHAFVGLEKRGLAEGGLQVVHPRQPKGGPPFRFWYPTMLGVELFLWGQGVGDQGLEGYTPAILQQIEMPLIIEPIDLKLGRIAYC